VSDPKKALYKWLMHRVRKRARDNRITHESFMKVFKPWVDKKVKEMKNDP